MRKMVSALVVLAAMSVGVVDAAASYRVVNIPSTPKASEVVADPLPLDLSNAPSLRAPTPVAPKVEIVQTTTPIEIALTWTCGAPQPLATDPTMTYRNCEYR